MGILDLIKKAIPGGKKRYAVYLTAKGKKIKVGVYEAKDENELVSKITRDLENNPEAENYPRLMIVDLQSGDTLRLKNPFAEEDITSGEASGGSRSKSSGISVEEVRKMVSNALEIQSSFYREIMKSMLGDIIALGKDIVAIRNAISPQQQQINLKDILAAIDGIRYLIENKEKVDKIISEAFKKEVAKE